MDLNGIFVKSSNIGEAKIMKRIGKISMITSSSQRKSTMKREKYF